MRNIIFGVLAIFINLFSVQGGFAQRVQSPDPPKDDKVFGKAYSVPEVKVYLTDEETGGPFAEREVTIKYYWGWDIIKRTAETDRIPSTLSLAIKRRTDVKGVVFLPTLLITPSGPPPPAGAEYSTPRFKYAGISVNDAKHSTYMSVFDAEVNLLDAKGEVHRTVMLYPRPLKK